MVNKKLVVIPLLILALCLFATSVLGAGIQTLTITSPSAGATMNGATNTITATLSSFYDAENCSLFYMNLSESWLVVSANSTDMANATTYSVNFDSTAYVDTATGTLNLTCYETNHTSGTADFDDATVDIDVDNTAPSCTATLDYDQTRRKSGLGSTVTCSCTDTVDSSLTYNVSLYAPDGFVKETSSTTLTASGSELLLVVVDSGYYFNCSAQDNAPIAGSTTASFNVLSDKEDVLVPIEEDVAVPTATIMVILLAVGGAGVIIAIVVVLSKKTKKRKRR